MTVDKIFSCRQSKTKGYETMSQKLKKFLKRGESLFYEREPINVLIFLLLNSKSKI